MTTWQDQPPLTRRQAREAERSQESAASPSPLTRRAVTTEPTPGGETPQLVTPYTGSIDTVSNGDGARAEKSDYDAVLAARPAAPNYAGSSFAAGSLTSAPPQAPAQVAPDEAPSFTTPASPTPEFRQRSYAPGGSAGLETAPPAVPATEAATEDAADGAVDGDGTPLRTLTRRELRAMLAEQEAAAAAESATEVVVSAPAALAEAEPTASDTGRRVTWSPPAPEPEAETRPVWETAQTAISVPPTVAVPVVPSATAAQPAAAIVVPPADAPVAPAPVAPPATSPFDFGHVEDVQPAKPIGHWSIAADHEDDRDVTGVQPSFDQLLSRGIAAGGVSAGGVPTTTSALILPSIPQSGDGSVALTTGEVLVTGSFDLPRSLGSTGAHPDRIDSSDIDRLFELEDAAPATGAQPIRASRAVSGHTSTRDVIQPPQKQSRWTVPFILSISAGVLAVGVVALIIAGLVSGIF